MPPAAEVAAPIARVIAFYETLTPASLDRLGEVYAEQARFKDPFNDVTGLVPIEKIFRAMFDQLVAPQFRVLQAVGDAERACLIWEFDFGSPRIAAGRTQQIRGASWLEFNSDGRVSLHRDYWDAAEELYEKLPGVGALARWLRRRFAH